MLQRFTAILLMTTLLAVIPSAVMAFPPSSLTNIATEATLDDEQKKRVADYASYWIEKTQTFHEEDFVRRGQDDLCLPTDDPGGCQAFPEEINVYFLAMLLLFIARRHKRFS